MLAHTLTGSTSYDDIKINVDTAKLGIIFKSTAVLSSDVKISIEIKDGGKSKEICQDVPIIDLLEFSANKEGFIRHIVSSAGVTEYTRGQIDLTENGSIPLNQNRYLSISISGAATGDEIKLYARNDNEIAEEFLCYDKQKVGSGQDKQNLMLVGQSFLVLQKSHLSKLELNYESGRVEKLDLSELEIDGDDNNDLVLVKQTATATTAQYGTYGLYIISCDNFDKTPNVVQAEVTTDSSAYQYYLISRQPLVEKQER